MDIKGVKPKVWEDVVKGDADISFDFLAVKMLIGRLQRGIKTDASPEAMNNAVEELQTLFQKVSHLPMGQKDFQKIMAYGEEV